MSWTNDFAAAIGRPRAIEGESMVVSDGLMASMVRPAQGGVYFMPVDEIIRRKGWAVYKDMLFDDQIKATLAFKKILVIGREHELQPANDTAQAKEIASFVEWCLKRIDVDTVFKGTVTAFEFGYSMGELVWTRDQYEGKQVVCLDKIAHRDPQELYLEMDAHGNYTGVKQLSMGQNIELPPEKTWLFSHNSRFGNIYGESDLRSAYRSWWAKKFIINFWNVFLERMGAPMMMMKYPTGSSNELKEVLKSILRNLASKTEVLVPEGVTVELIEAQRSGNATYDGALEFHNNAIARALLMVALLGTGGENSKTQGSQSQSSLHLRLIFKMADQLSQEISKSFMCQVVKQLVEFNYGKDAAENLMPTWVWQDYGQYEASIIADEIRQLHTAGIIDMDQTDVNYVRSLMGLALRNEGDKPDDVVRPEALPPPANGTPPPPAKQGNTNADKGGSARTKDATSQK